MRRSLIAGPLAVVGAFTLLLGGCPAAELARPDRLCTPNDYVYCRCADRSEGTKQCSSDGLSFAECDCAGGGDGPVVIDDGGFTRIDAGQVDANGPMIDNNCAGKLAALAGGEEDLLAYGAAYTGQGQWAVSTAKGPALRSVPRGGLVDNALVTVWQTRFSLLAWTKFEANQTSLSLPVSIGSATTTRAPAFGSDNATGQVFSLADDNTMKEGVYTSKNGWDDATTTVTGAEKVAGKGAPAVAVVAGELVLGFTDTFKTLFVQSRKSGTWGEPFLIATAKAYDDDSPALTALHGGTEDLLLVYRGEDTVLRWVARAGATWSVPARVDTTATADATPALASMSNGRALVSWMVPGGAPFFSVYDPTKTPRWTAPSVLFNDNTAVKRSPFVSPGHCASEVTATLVTPEGSVLMGFYSTGKPWSGPFPIPGMSKMSYAAAGEVP